MSIHISIIEGPIPPAKHPTHLSGEGAALTFDGIVRPTEDGRPLAALRYETYEPMATNMMQSIAQELTNENALLGFQVWHSRGFVPVGEVSMRVEVRSSHRKEAIAALDAFIDRLKRDVPIWKHPVWAEYF